MFIINIYFICFAFAKVKPENYKNYFNYAYDKKQFKIPSKQSTRRRTLKNYKKV